MNQKMTHDNYYDYFITNEYDSLILAQNELEKASHWELCEDVMAIEVSPDPLETIAKINSGSTIPSDIYEDTFSNSGIMLNYNFKEECIRDCAMPSLLNTIGLTGSAINRAKKSNLAIGLSAFLNDSRPRSQILMRAGKVSAVVSMQYQYMPASELLSICDDLELTFGKAKFISGCVSHSLTTAQWEFPESKDAITSAYSTIVGMSGRKQVSDITPIVQLRTSDTSSEAAKLITFLKIEGLIMPLSCVSVNHVLPKEYDDQGVRISCLTKFRQESESLFSKMEYDLNDVVPKMLETPIFHPGNTFVGLCKYALIPQKWGGLIEENIRSEFPDGSNCCFLDLYEALCQVITMAINEGLTPTCNRVLDLEEAIYKVANNRISWTRYDNPGTVAWSRQ